MKILYITLENLSLHKGSVVHIKEIVTGLQKLGHRVGLIAYSREKFGKVDSFYNLYKFLRIKRQSYIISSLSLFICLFKFLPKYDVIYARDFHTVIIAFFPRLILRKKLVFEINGLANEEQSLKGNSLLNRVFTILIKMSEKIATRCSNRIVSVTPQIASYLEAQFNCSEKRIDIVNNGVNTEIFKPIYNEDLLESWRKKLGIKKEDRVITFVGNLAPWQGVNILIESASCILSKEMKTKIFIIGDGLLKKVLKKKAFDSGFNNNFIFTGMVNYEDIPVLINLADICVAPFVSKRNRKTGVSPLKVFEYMACGKPVVASRIEGLEFIESEGVGHLIEPEDVQNLVKVINNLLNDEDKRMNMSKKSLQIAWKFSWERRVVEIENILRGLA
jgi:glycosyltransferase involved in cell wall biosynthesis